MRDVNAVESIKTDSPVGSVFVKGFGRWPNATLPHAHGVARGRICEARTTKIRSLLDQEAAASNFTKGASSSLPAAARQRMIFAISVRLAGVRMVAGNAATDWSKILPKSESCSGS